MRITFRHVRVAVLLGLIAGAMSFTEWQGDAQAQPRALQFNSANSQYVTFGVASSLGASSFTLEVWFKKTGDGVGTGTGSGGIGSAIPLLTKGRAEADGSTRDMNYFLGIDVGPTSPTLGKLVADFEEGTGQLSPGLNHPIAGTTTIQSNVWYHAAATFDSATGAWNLYLNGVQEASATLGANRAPQSASIQHAALGTAITSGTPTPPPVAAGFFTGILEEPRIWNYARSQVEIQSSRGVEITSAPGLIGRWGLNEGSGTTASGVGPVGTLSSAATPTPVPPTWVTGLTLTGAAPPVPQNLSASAGNGLVTLAWNGSTDPDLLGYKVYRSTSSPVPTSGQPLSGPSPVPSAIYTDRPAANGTTYYYAVKTIYPSGESSASNEASATPEQFAGSALQFNGTDQHVTFGTAPGLGATTFTIETWFKRTGQGIGTSTGSGGIADVIPLVSKGRAQADGSNVDMNYILGIRASTGVLAADFEDTPTGGNHPVLGQTVIPVSTTQWHHAAATFDGQALRLYLDGILEATQSASGFTPRFDSIQHAALGTAMTSTGSADGRFAGILEEVRIWNYARTATQIQSTIYQEVEIASGLLGRWGMNEAAGTTTADSSGNNINGTFSGPPTWAAGYPFVPDGTGPDAPTNLIATPGNQTAALTWNANSEADLAGYNVYRSTATPVSTVGSPINGVTLLTTESYNDTGLTNGVTYYYAVTAVDIFNNESLPSVEANATPFVPNVPPSVNAGPDQTIALPSDATLVGTANDDGMPSGTLTVTWSLFNGPAPVIFADAHATSTTASFSEPGAYVLRLTGSDGVLSSTDDVTVTVSDPVLIGAGDIAPDCVAGASILNAQATATLLAALPGTVFTLGDNAYQDGTAQQFSQCYDAAWGPLKARTRPAAGNHDYNPNPLKGSGNNATPYFDYFNGAGQFTGPAGDRDKGYYSYDIGTPANRWHVVVLNSECESSTGLWLPNGCAAGSVQEQWLRADLAASTTNNIIAMWHKPRFSSSASDNAIAHMQPLWRALYEYGVDVVLGGHWHNYERLAPTDANGLADADFGIRQFIVGTGGIPFSNFGTTRTTSQIRQNTDHGILKLTLHAGSYDWQFIPIAGKTFTDSGTAPVHGPPPGPVITGIAPIYGPPGGGTAVTITGSNFGTLTPTTVRFGNTPATSVTCSSPTLCTATSPAGTGAVDVQVEVGGQTSPVTSAAIFTYNTAPVVTAGTNQTITTLDTTLTGSVNDDGLPNPPGALTLTWAKVSGPGTVTFGTPSLLSTTATFSSVGTYVLRLSANDGLAVTTSDVGVRVVTAPGAANRALQFNGTSQYVTFGSASELGASTFTLETWFKREGPGTNASTGSGGVTAAPLLTKGRNESDGSAVDMNYFLGIDASERVLVADFEDTANGTNHPAKGVTRIADGVWYHAAATYDGSAWRLYLNGTLEAQTNVGSFTPRSDSIQHAAIGTALNSTGVASGFFAGVIDEARVWNVARSGSQIVADMDAPLSSAPNLVGSWGLNEGSGGIAIDDAGTANDGALTGTPAWVDGTPFITTPMPPGNYGVTFSGASDYVSLGPAPALGTAAFTIETWFKRTGQGIGTSTGTGGFEGTDAIPLVTKGRGQGEGSNIDMNYFLGIHATSGVLIADFEDMAAGTNHPVSGQTTLPIDATRWHHAAATYDGQTWRLYLDGVPDGTADVGNFTPRSDSIQHAALATAMTSAGAPAGFFAGVLDEARIWNHARSQAQIVDGMGRAITGATGLLGRWGFDTNWGLVNDTTGNAQHGLLFGPTWNWIAGATLSGPTNLAPVVNAGADQTIDLGETATLSGTVTDDGFPGIDITVAWTKVTGPGTVSFDDADAESTMATFSAAGVYVLKFSADDGEAVGNDTVTVTVSAAEVNNALDLGGTNAYVNLGSAPGLGASTFTLELWFRRDGTGIPTNTGSGGMEAIPLVTKGMAQTDGGNVDMNYFLGIRSSDNLLGVDFEDTATGANHPAEGTTAIPPDGVWHHAAATYDGTTWRLYLDGVLQKTTLVGSFTPRFDSTQWAAIGSASNSTGGITSGQTRGFFDGVVDEVRIWNYARSAQQIADSMNLQIAAGTGLIGRWGLNEGAGGTVADTSGSGVTGTIVGSAFIWTSGAPFTLNLAPVQPTLNAPTDNATEVPTSPTLDVSVSDPDGQNLNVTFFGRAVGAAAAPEFTIVAIPDTQHYVDDPARAATFTAQTQWIVNNKVDKNIAFVTHLGDIVEHIDAQPIEWTRAHDSLRLLDDNNFQWGLAPGNHDMNSAGVAENYDLTFPVSRFATRSWYGGYLGKDQLDPINRQNKDNYELFSVGGLDFIIIHLEYDMPDYAVAWANRILQLYPNRRAIISTHLFLNASGTRPTTFLNRSNGTPAETVWQQLIRPNCNVFLVLNGHYPGEANRTDTNACGKRVHQLASDYQSRTNGGDGWLRYMVFKPAENKINVFTFSPTLNGGAGQFETDANSQFVLDYDMQGTSFSEIGTQSGVPSGSSVTLPWANLAGSTQHEWYVKVSDGIATTTGPTWSFTTVSGNLAPELAAIGNQNTSEGTLLAFTVSATDPNSDPVTYSASGLPTGATFNTGTRAFNWTPGFNQAGSYQVTFTATDGELQDEEEITIVVDNTNRPPAVTNPGNQTTTESAAVNLPIVASDPDGDVLTYEAVGLPAGLSIHPSTGVISGTVGSASSWTPTVTVRDASSQSSVNFAWTVFHVNVAPSATAQTVTTAQDTAKLITLSATDSDGPGVLTFTIVTQPAHGTLTGTAPSVTYTPTLDYNGPDSFTFRASDGQANSNIATVTINVSAAGIGFRAATFAHNGGSSSMTLTRPAALAPNDLMLAAIALTQSAATTITPPAGWSLVRDPASSTPLDHTMGTFRQVLFAKIAGPSEPASYSWSFGASRNASGGISAYSGVNVMAPFDVAAGSPNASSTSITAPSVITRFEGTRLIGVFGVAVHTTVAPPSRMAERGEVTAGKVKVAVEIADVNQQAIPDPSEGTGLRTATASTAAVNIGQIIALRPAGVVGPPPPAAPDALTAVAGNSRVDLSWSAVPDADGYRLYRGTTSGGPYGPLAVPDSTATGFPDTGVTNNTTYYYVVRAFNAFGESPNSPQASATPQVACVAVALSPSSLLGGRVGTLYNQTITASGGTSQSFTFTLTAGSLPPGLTLSSAGVLSGTPRNGAGGKTFNFTVTARDANTCTGSRAYSLSISK